MLSAWNTLDATELGVYDMTSFYMFKSKQEVKLKREALTFMVCNIDITRSFVKTACSILARSIFILASNPSAYLRSLNM